MASRYPFRPEYDLYYATMTVVEWIDIFSRELYVELLYNSWKHCMRHKGLRIHAYVIMTNHVHWVISTTDQPLSGIVRDMKQFTAKRIIADLQTNFKESRRHWMKPQFAYNGRYNPNNKFHQVWQQKNHAIPLWSPHIIQQKINYIHNNPVKAGYVNEAWEYRHSSASQYAGMKGVFEVESLLF